MKLLQSSDKRPVTVCCRRTRISVAVRCLGTALVVMVVGHRAHADDPPTVVVNTNDVWDYDKVDLQEALSDVADGGTIQFAMPDGEDVDIGYQITVTKNLTIEGPGAEELVIRRGFVVAVGKEVEISGVTFKFGSKWVYDDEGGGALANYGTVTVSECTFTLNVADDVRGGAIHNLGTMTVSDCLFDSNTADGDSGGAIANDGELIVERTRFSGNSVTALGYIEGGAAIDNGAAGTMTLRSDCVFENNTTEGTPGMGGAIRNEGDADIMDCEFTGNESNDYGGAIYSDTTGSVDLIVERCEFTSNTGEWYGGAVRIKSGLGNLSECTFTSNSCEYGGAVANGGDCTMTDCTITTNTATESGRGGGGIYNSGDLLLEGTELIGNTATEGDGGAICNYEGASLTINDAVISGNNCPMGEGGAILNDDGATLTIEGAVISGNTAFESGGGIANRQEGTVTCTMVELADNRVTDEYGEGGGIANAGVCTLVDCHVHDNDCEGDSSDGGGVYSQSGYSGTVEAELSLLRCTVADNSCVDDGAGVYSCDTSSLGATLLLRDSTISGNQGLDPDSSSGGGVKCEGVAQIINSTISGNSAESGGGIYGYGCELLLAHSTVSANNALYSGGGLYVRLNPGSSMTHTIVGGNSGRYEPDGYRSSSGSDLTSGGHNVIGDMDGFSFTLGSGDAVGAPGLAPLADNGGPTWTHALLAGSLAADGGDPAFDPGVYAPALTTDQRGSARVDGPRIDIGAYEGGVVVAIGVDVFDDVDNGDFEEGDRSLREALSRANASTTPVIISLPAGTYPVEQGEFPITNTSQPMAITGTGSVVLDAGNDSRIFNIAPGADLEIEGLVLSKGQSPSGGDGGAVYNGGTFTAENCRFEDGLSAGNGGAIASHGSLMLTDCTFEDNRAEIMGGAIANYAGLIAEGCRFFENGGDYEQGGDTHADRGGAIGNNGSSTLTDCRFERNRSTIDGGAIFNAGSLTAVDCYVWQCKSESGAGVLDNSGAAVLTKCWLAGNGDSGSDGASIENLTAATLTMTNCFSLGPFAGGGHVRDQGGDATLKHCTLLWGARGDVGLESWGGVLRIGHCMVSEIGRSGDIDPLTVTSLGYNMVFNPGEEGVWAKTTGDILGEMPLIVGSALLPGSRGVDCGDQAFADPTLTTDIYGHPRVAGGQIDIGAIEVRDHLLSLDDFIDDFFTLEQLADPEVSDPSGDPDGDGKATELEAFAGGTPSTADGVRLLSMVGGAGGGGLPFSPMNGGSGGAGEFELQLDERMTFLRGEVFSSDDLGGWSRRAVYRPLGAGMGYERRDVSGLTFVDDEKSGYIWTIRESLDGAGANGFVRITVAEE